MPAAALLTRTETPTPSPAATVILAPTVMVVAAPGELASGRSHLRRDLLLYDCDGAEQALITWELLEQ